MLTHLTAKELLITFLATIYVSVLSSEVDTILVIDQSNENLLPQVPSIKINMSREASSQIRTPVPVIGILAQVLRDNKRFTKKRQLHIVSSYVKWIESAGAQAMPILLNQNDSYYEKVFSQTNGLLFPGGDNLLDPTKDTPMMLAAKKLYKLAVEANQRGDFYPIWGTCLGLELLSVLSSNRNELDSCLSMDTPSRMSFVERGRLFAPNKNANLEVLDKLDYSKIIMDTLEQQAVVYNYHRKCLTDEGMKRANLLGFYRPIAYSNDSNGLNFISIFEAIDLPFYGVQFHPEKPPFEFAHGEGHMNVPHSRESIEVSRYFADFFVRQAQLNRHKTNDATLQMHLIYAYNTMYTAPLGDMYEQRYLFPFSAVEQARSRGQMYMLVDDAPPVKNKHLLIEFLDHIPKSDEEIPEDISDDDSISDDSPVLIKKSPVMMLQMRNSKEALN